MKLNDFKSFIEAHKRTFKLKPETADKPAQKVVIERHASNDGSEHQQKQLPYHAVLRPRIVPRHHLLHTIAPIH
ncbi:MAG TPA: hypothetical protein VLA88_00885 [Candidatus Saccharimonadales bacterium]|nr:hypothetical protein [Candidatus Saccharimonadales bacterium]